jgi:hypothetical protein
VGSTEPTRKEGKNGCRRMLRHSHMGIPRPHRKPYPIGTYHIDATPTRKRQLYYGDDVANDEDDIVGRWTRSFVQEARALSLAQQ